MPRKRHALGSLNPQTSLAMWRSVMSRAASRHRVGLMRGVNGRAVCQVSPLS